MFPEILTFIASLAIHNWSFTLTPNTRSVLLRSAPSPPRCFYILPNISSPHFFYPFLLPLPVRFFCDSESRHPNLYHNSKSRHPNFYFFRHVLPPRKTHRVRQAKLSTPSTLSFPTSTSTSGPQTSVPSFPPHKKTYVSQTSLNQRHFRNSRGAFKTLESCTRICLYFIHPPISAPTPSKFLPLPPNT